VNRYRDAVYVIVGLDAGVKVGYAVIDLDGNLVSAGCEKEANDESIVKIISSVGKPSVVASDVSKPSKFVSKVAARFNVKVHSPKKSMSMKEKRSIGENIIDPHVRDAYAAAVKTYRNYANRLRQVNKLDTKKNKDELKHLVIQGQALTKVIRRKTKKKTGKKVRRKSSVKKTAKKSRKTPKRNVKSKKKVKKKKRK